MPERKITWSLYGVALAITIVIFITGLYLGAQLTSGVNSELQGQLDQLRAKMIEVEVLQLLDPQSQNTTRLCSFYESKIAEFDQATSDFGLKLEFLEKKRGRADAGVQELKREFMLMELRDFVFVQKVNQLCGSRVNTVLFFYTNENCPACTQQGAIGPDLKRADPGKIMIYAFDADLRSPAVEALKSLYGVSSYPSLVVNGKLLSGFNGLNAVRGLLYS